VIPDVIAGFVRIFLKTTSIPQLLMPLSNEEKQRRKAAEKLKNARERNKLKVIEMNFFISTDN
jgi:hypothetical protein